MSASRPCRTSFTPLLLALPFLIGCPEGGFLAAEEASPPSSLSGSIAQTPGSERMTLDAWRALKDAAEEAMNAPAGPERIAKCEAFLKEHPDYPEPKRILRTLVDDTLEMGNYDPAQVAGLIERLAKPVGDSTDLMSAWYLEHYYLKYGLPLDSARRVLNWSREAIERQIRRMEKEPDPQFRDASYRGIQEFRLLLDEGRLLLAEGNPAGALKKLREAEAAARDAGQGLVLTDTKGRAVASFSPGTPFLDWLNLSLATARTRLGDPAAAKERLRQVRNFGGPSSEIAGPLEALREELKVPSPALTEVRADPVPAADFSLPDMDGKRVSLSDYRGKVVLAMLWTTW